MNDATFQRQAYSVLALREMARKRLPRMVFDLADGAAGDERTMRRNEQAVAETELIPKVLNGAPTRKQTVELFGHTLNSPMAASGAGLMW